MKDFLDIDEQIERNEKALDFFYSNYQKTQAKLTILIIIYSLIAVYLVQVIKYPFEEFKNNVGVTIVYILFLGTFLFFLLRSLYNTYLLVKPVNVAYIHHPKKFYIDIRERYEQKLQTTDENVLNAYVKATYLQELEKSVSKNSDLFETKGNYYFTAFTHGLIALLLYLFCVGFIIFKSDKPNEVVIKNFDSVVNTIGNQKCKSNKKCVMSEENKKEDSKKEKVKVDPKKVIKTEPKLIKENFSKQEKKDSSDQEK